MAISAVLIEGRVGIAWRIHTRINESDGMNNSLRNIDMYSLHFASFRVRRLAAYAHGHAVRQHLLLYRQRLLHALRAPHPLGHLGMQQLPPPRSRQLGLKRGDQDAERRLG